MNGGGGLCWPGGLGLLFDGSVRTRFLFVVVDCCWRLVIVGLFCLLRRGGLRSWILDGERLCPLNLVLVSFELTVLSCRRLPALITSDFKL